MNCHNDNLVTAPGLELGQYTRYREASVTLTRVPVIHLMVLLYLWLYLISNGIEQCYRMF